VSVLVLKLSKEPSTGFQGSGNKKINDLTLSIKQKVNMVRNNYISDTPPPSYVGPLSTRDGASSDC
jgi:hypothetical protein